MSLLQSLTYPEYKKALALSTEQCERIAKLADLDISFAETTKPGELLMKELDKKGCSAKSFNRMFATLHIKTVLTYYKPHAKVAILIANDKYMYLTKLDTPSIDCDSIGMKLQNLGFIVVMIKNTISSVLKEVFRRICDVIPEDSYGLTFYAGHGCQLCNTKCLLSIDCPIDNIQPKHCTTENYLLREIGRCKMDLSVCIMDMCRIHLDRETNPDIYASMIHIEDFTVHKNLLISYSCQSDESAYEVLQIECSTTIDNGVTYERKDGDTDKIMPGASQYVNALCTRIDCDLDVSSMLDKVHEDIERSIKMQRALKVQCGVQKRSLYDPVIGDSASLLIKLQEVAKEFADCCTVF